MVKGSGSSYEMCQSPFCLGSWIHKQMERRVRMEKNVKRAEKDVIAYRKKCKANGTGLSHYILMDKRGK